MVALCALARWLLDDQLGGRAPLSMFFIAVVVCAVTSNSAAAVLATVLSMLVGQMLFVDPPGYPLPVGTEQWFQWLVFALVGAVISLMSARLVASRDRERIFARRERIARDTLQESEDRFRLMLDSMEDFAVFLIDSDRRIRGWNVGAEKLFGAPSMDMEGTSYSRLFDAATPEEARQSADQFLSRTIETGRYDVPNARYVRSDRSTFAARVVLTALRDSAGEVRGFAHVARPVEEHATIG